MHASLSHFNFSPEYDSHTRGNLLINYAMLKDLVCFSHGNMPDKRPERLVEAKLADDCAPLHCRHEFEADLVQKGKRNHELLALT